MTELAYDTYYMNDLPTLIECGDDIVYKDDVDTCILNEHADELVETAMHLMHEYVEHNPDVILDPDFRDILLDEITEMFYIQLENHTLDDDDLDELLEIACDLYIDTFHKDDINDVTNEEAMDEEVIEDEEEIVDESIDIIGEKIQRLRELPQPAQRTPEWYNFRWNVITASNAWKCLGTQSSINQIIYEKCQPIIQADPTEIVSVNTNSPMHWGQVFEPVSVMLYEAKYLSKVEEFGCIQHPVYNFLAASPDGVVIESADAKRYGRMLEIKNVVSREINGVAKKEYWVQMQLQMEVCDLDECDFLETKFVEYDSYSDYLEDGIFTKGIIIQFSKPNGSIYYEYMKLNITNESEWRDEMVDKYQTEPYNYMFIKFIYWKLEVFSCVLVKRDRLWFQNNIKQFENVWRIIEKERVTGYKHRASIKRVKKEPAQVNDEICFMKVVKLDN